MSGSHFGCRVGRQMPLSSVRQYAAAKTSRLTGDWFPVNQDVNTLIRTSSPLLRSRIRQLVRDFPYFARAIKVLTDYTVGAEGITFQSRVIDEAASKDGKVKFDKTAIRKIEEAVARGMEELDAAGKLHGAEMERLSQYQDVECGEYVFVKTASRDTGRFIPYALQAYEPDWLTGVYAQVAQGNTVDQGVEFDPLTGRRVAYHFAVPSGYGTLSLTASTSTQRVLAPFVLHDFETLRPGQLRGVSALVTAVLIAHDLGDYMDATIDTAKLAARYLAIITTSDAGGFQRNRTQDGQGAQVGKKIESIENAIIEYLRPGEDIKFADQKIPGDQVSAFCKFVLRMLAVATGVTYELLTGDYDGVSFSNLKGIRNDFAVAIRPRQMRHIRHWSKPVTYDIIESAVLAGRIDLPGYWKDPWHYQRGVFIPPGMESADRLRDMKAFVEEIRTGQRSPQEMAAARGRDIEEILDELAQFRDMLQDKQLDFILHNIENASTARANNPAALGAAEGGKNA